MGTVSDRFLYDFINSIMVLHAKKKQIKEEDGETRKKKIMIQSKLKYEDILGELQVSKIDF